MSGEIGLNLSPFALAVTAMVVFAASIARGYAGFGFSTLLMVCLAPWVPIAQLVPISIALEIIASSAQARKILPDVKREFLVILLAASLLGAPFGVLLLTYVPDRSLQLLVLSVVLISTLFLLAARPQPVTVTLPYLFIAGLVAGAVNGATALSGLVLALFFTSSTVSSQAMRATMIAYLFFTDVITGALLLAADRYDVQTALRVLFALPFLLAGIWVGTRQFLTTPTQSFKSIVMWLLVMFCIVGVIRLL